jgi:hypothetical protein
VTSRLGTGKSLTFFTCNTHRKTTGDREGLEEAEGMRNRGKGAGSVKKEGCGWREKREE